jgi:putative transposase
LTLAYLDECGFSPSQPVSYSWTYRGMRKVIPYENPDNRRVNVMAVYIPYGPERTLWWNTAARGFRSEDLLAFVEAIPRGDRELVVVLDNAGMHRSHTVQDERPILLEQGIRLYYLPAYSPELNAIEPWFGVAKHTEMPERTYYSVPDLTTAINRALERTEARLLNNTQQQPRLAA